MFTRYIIIFKQIIFQQTYHLISCSLQAASFLATAPSHSNVPSVSISRALPEVKGCDPEVLNIGAPEPRP